MIDGRHYSGLPLLGTPVSAARTLWPSVTMVKICTMIKE